MNNLNSIPKDVYKVLDGKALSDPELIARFGSEVGKLLKNKIETSDRGSPTLRMSNIGRPLRQLWYEQNGYVPEKITGKTLLKFLYGDLTETLVLALVEQAGYTIERQQEEIDVDGIKGHIDGVINGVLVDIKSCSSHSFLKFQTGDLLLPGNDPFGYVGQLSGYASALKLPASWVAFDKVSGEVCILELPEEKIKDYNVNERIVKVRSSVASPVPPERCYSPVPVSKADKTGNMVLGVGCSYCGWKQECWKESNNGTGLQIRFYSTGPKFFTTLVKEPRLNNDYVKTDFQFPTKQEESNSL